MEKIYGGQRILVLKWSSTNRNLHFYPVTASAKHCLIWNNEGGSRWEPSLQPKVKVCSQRFMSEITEEEKLRLKCSRRREEMEEMEREREREVGSLMAAINRKWILHQHLHERRAAQSVAFKMLLSIKHYYYILCAGFLLQVSRFHSLRMKFHTRTGWKPTEKVWSLYTCS